MAAQWVTVIMKKTYKYEDSRISPGLKKKILLLITRFNGNLYVIMIKECVHKCVSPVKCVQI